MMKKSLLKECRYEKIPTCVKTQGRQQSWNQNPTIQSIPPIAVQINDIQYEFCEINLIRIKESWFCRTL